MNDDRSGGAAPASEDETAQPNRNPSGWQMPAPKFQQTSGYLPQGYLGSVGLENPAAWPAGPPDTSPDVEVPPLPGDAVEPQPELAEVLADGTPAAQHPTAAVNERSTGMRVAFVVLGLLGMVAFIAIFLAVVYYLFINPQNGGSTF